MKKIFISLIALGALIVPAIALAQVPGTGPVPDFTYTNSWIVQLVFITQKAVTFLMVIATLYFIWTVISYIHVKEAKDAEEKKKAMLRGIIGLVVIVGIWGIVGIIARTFGVNGGSNDPTATPCPPGMQYNVQHRLCE